MASLTLDHLSGGRHILGLGVSGPQVVEGWYGQKFPKPLARTREYIDIVRQVWAREAPVASEGPHYPLPLTGEGTILGVPCNAAALIAVLFIGHVFLSRSRHLRISSKLL